MNWNPMATAVSRDGTRIAYWQSGSGPPVVLVHGGWADHTSWDLVVPWIGEQFTVYAIDRRGCGQSDPYREDYEVERDWEDVAAIVDMFAEPVHVVGHSIGATWALYGALLTSEVGSLVLYEPPLGIQEQESRVIDRIEALVEIGDRDGAATAFMHEVAGVPWPEIERQRKSPTWSNRLASVHAISPGLRAFSRFAFDPDRLRKLKLPTTLLVGEHSSPYHKSCAEIVANAVSAARLAVLPGQWHSANVTAPHLLADAIQRALHEGRTPGVAGAGGSGDDVAGLSGPGHLRPSEREPVGPQPTVS